MACNLSVQLAVATTAVSAGGVSSFGYSGTIAHAVLASGNAVLAVELATSCRVTQPLVYRRRPFPWFTLPAATDERVVSASMAMTGATRISSQVPSVLEVPLCKAPC